MEGYEGTGSVRCGTVRQGVWIIPQNDIAAMLFAAMQHKRADAKRSDAASKLQTFDID